LQVMEAERSRLVVVLAGYKDRMDTFFRSNPGMSSRVAHHIDFPDYSVDELVSIGQMMLDGRAYRLSPDAEVAFRDYIARRSAQPRFANARSIRNAIDRARLRQAGRLFSLDADLTRDQLITIEADDILKSSVFDDDMPDSTRR
jgi:AAA lid domain